MIGLDFVEDIIVKIGLWFKGGFLFWSSLLLGSFVGLIAIFDFITGRVTAALNEWAHLAFVYADLPQLDVIFGVVNYVFPLNEMLVMITTLAALKISGLTYSAIKSWIPTISS